MKKGICLILALALALTCAVSLAESAEMSSFVRILKDTKVYSEAAGSEGTDTLAAETLCGLIEEVAAGGETWFHVLYLNSAKKGAEGYIRAEDAQQLTVEELKAELENLEKANDVLDLIDALNDYLKNLGSNSTATTDGTNQDDTSVKDLISKFYSDAMTELGKVFNTDISGIMGDISATGTELLGKVTETGSKIVESAKKTGSDLLKTGENLLGQAKEAGENLLGEAGEAGENLLKTGKDLLGEAGEAGKNLLKTGEDLLGKTGINGEDLLKSGQDLLGNVGETIESLEKKIGMDPEKIEKTLNDTLKNLEKLTGTDTKGAAEKITKMVSSVKDMLDSEQFSVGKVLSETFSNVLSDPGIKSGTEKIQTLIQNIPNLLSPANGK